MKALKLLALALLFVSCSKDDDCSGNYDEIYNQYQVQIDYVMNHPIGGLIDYRQIDLLKQERDKKLQNACR